MAGLVKLACLVLALHDCGRACCTGVSKLNSIARTTPDRQQACRCLKTAASALGSGLNAGRAAGLPKACGVNVPFPISLLTPVHQLQQREISSLRMKLEWTLSML
ncbi:hypothetical protein Bca52824_049473 [Brassica carinata]|uniref:Non-specific lipid-transfer protein n=1 Tax=Brassica carinata TaxID=52824 RepID=A0A8X7RQH9_BRACI|nr:hypothetical protein Bca52824_049473 [Brassica carinata]